MRVSLNLSGSTLWCCLAILVTVPSGGAYALEDYANPQIQPLYQAESLLPNRIAVQYEATPANETWIQIRHMGDVGTAELEQQASNPVNTPREHKTGLMIPAIPGFGPGLFQRGYEDDPTRGTNVYQVYGRQFGWHINTFQFGSDQPIECPPQFPECSGGPNIAYSRRFEPALNPWPTESSELTLQVFMKMPTVHYKLDGGHPAAQVSFLYYLEHEPTGFQLAGLINLFDSRPFEQVGYERSASDGVTAYVSSDLQRQQPDGSPYRYHFQSPYSAPGRNQYLFNEERFFRTHISREHLRNILDDTNAPGTVNEYRLLEAAILIEAFPRKTGNISIAGSIRDFSVYRFFESE